jgi:hypothetical protein
MSLFLTSPAGPLLACAACFGQSDSAMAQGMNWGILSLLGIIALVLGGVASFFVYLAKRTSALAASTGSEKLLEPTPPSVG